MTLNSFACILQSINNTRYKIKYKFKLSVKWPYTYNLHSKHHKEKRHTALIQHHMSCLMRNSIKSHFGLTFTGHGTLDGLTTNSTLCVVYMCVYFTKQHIYMYHHIIMYHRICSRFIMQFQLNLDSYNQFLYSFNFVFIYHLLPLLLPVPVCFFFRLYMR